MDCRGTPPPDSRFLSIKNDWITATPIIYRLFKAAFMLQWAELSHYNGNLPMDSLTLVRKSSPPCSGAWVLSHCTELPRLVLNLLLLIPQPQYPSAHSILPVFLAKCLKYVFSCHPHCDCLTSGSCKLWPGLIKHPVFVTSLLPSQSLDSF